MLDADLADLYGVSTKRLNEQVRRNLNRFPPDFMFQLNEEEIEILRPGGWMNWKKNMISNLRLFLRPSGNS